MSLDSAAYRHDFKLLNQLLDDGEVPTATTLCNLVNFESKSVNLQRQNVEAVKRLLQLGLNPNELPFEGHAPAVDLAAGNPNTLMLKLLLESGARPTSNNTIHCAISEDLDENLQLLIDYGVGIKSQMHNADPNDDFTPVPLEYAKEINSKKCLKLLNRELQ